MGEIHELFILALSLVLFAGATPDLNQAVLQGVPFTGLQVFRSKRLILLHEKRVDFLTLHQRRHDRLYLHGPHPRKTMVWNHGLDPLRTMVLTIPACNHFYVLFYSLVPRRGFSGPWF